MGDRANIVVIDEREDADLTGKREAVFLYTHWTGSDLGEILAAGLVKGRSRWDDSPYLARILFQEMIEGDTGTTGYGISTTLTDNEYDLYVVDVARQVVVRYPEQMYESSGFGRLREFRGTTFDDYASKAVAV